MRIDLIINYVFIYYYISCLDRLMLLVCIHIVYHFYLVNIANHATCCGSTVNLGYLWTVSEWQKKVNVQCVQTKLTLSTFFRHDVGNCDFQYKKKLTVNNSVNFRFR